MSRSLFHSLSKEFDDTLDTSLYPFETKRKWKGCGVREIALELPRSSTRSDIRPFVAFLNEPVHSYPSIGPRGLHYSKRRESIIPRLFLFPPLAKFHEIPRQRSMLVGYSRRIFPGGIHRRNLKIFSRVGLERESRKIPRKMENISSKWKNSFVPSAE